MTEPSKVTSKVADSTLFDHLDTTWEFKAGPTPSTTWLNFDLTFAFKSPLYRQIASVFFDEVSSLTDRPEQSRQRALSQKVWVELKKVGLGLEHSQMNYSMYLQAVIRFALCRTEYLASPHFAL